MVPFRPTVSLISDYLNDMRAAFGVRLLGESLKKVLGFFALSSRTQP